MASLDIDNACTTSRNEPVGTTSLPAASCNLSFLDRLSNTTDPTATNRVGVTIPSISGRNATLDTFEATALQRVNDIGVIYDSPIRPWSAGLLVSDLRAHTIGGVVYIPTATLPFTTGLTFNVNNWAVYQGITQADQDSDASVTKTFTTVAAYRAYTSELATGKTVRLDDRNADFKVISGTSTGNNENIIASSQVSQSIVFVSKNSEALIKSINNPQTALDNYENVFDYSSEYVLPTTLSVLNSLNGNGRTLFSLTGFDLPTIQCGNTTDIATGVTLKNVLAQGDPIQPSNNQAVITIDRCHEATITGNRVIDGYNSMGCEFSDTIPPPGEERRTINSVIAHNILQGTYIGIEAFSPFACAFVGNVASRAGKTQGTQHGLRITGYGPDHLSQGHDLRNRGNAYVGNVYNNYANGVSLQAGVYGNIINFVATDCINGFASTENTTAPDAISSGNDVTMVADNVSFGAFIFEPRGSSYRGTIQEASTRGIETRAATRGAKGNSYDLVVGKSEAGGRFEDSHSRISVTARELQSGGVQIINNFNLVDAVISDINLDGGTSVALSVSGDNNLVRVVTDAISNPVADVNVTGDGNDLTMVGDTGNSEGLVTVTGTGNIIRGNCTITAASVAGNDYSGVFGWSQADNYSATTDAGGRFTLPLTVPISTFSINMNSIDFTTHHYNICLTGQSTSNATFIVYDQAGAIVPSTSFNTRWDLVCFKN